MTWDVLPTPASVCNTSERIVAAVALHSYFLLVDNISRDDKTLISPAADRKFWRGLG